jgi:hypothetical protein
MIESRRKRLDKLQLSHPDTAIIDVTSRGELPWVRFSPFFPHGGIPIPFSPVRFAKSVEGIWQGLKVFETEDVDPAKWEITNMKGIKRSTRSRGRVLGHRQGVQGDALLDYLQARRQIYLPVYRWVLENRLREEVAQLQAIAAQQPLVLLDYETNADVSDLRRPLSHAALIRRFLEND